LSDNLGQTYAQEFAKAMQSPYLPNVPYPFNPYVVNEILKNVNMNPSGQDRDDLIKMVQNPKANEKQLRWFAQYLYNVQTPFKRLAHYYPDMLTFDLSLYPINATEKDMRTDDFKRQYDKAWKYLTKLDYKKEFQKIAIGMMVEDVKYMYIREDANRISFQEMPSNYCIIDSKFTYGWLYSFDLNYFSQQGVDINSFAPEFKEYYSNYLQLLNKNMKYNPSIKPELRDGRWAYWQQINPKNSWVFKFHDQFAGIVPPLLGIFVDANEIDTFKQLQSTKTALDVFKLLIGIIPINKDKNGTKTDNLAISAELAGQFNQLINNNLPDGIKFGTVPFDDVKAFDFSKNSQTKNDIVGDALKSFYKTSGSDQALFNAEKPNATTMKASTAVDAAFVSSMYSTFESFLNYQLIKKFDKFSFKVKFSGTIFDQEERFDTAMKAAERGIITPELPAAMGLNEKEFRDGLALMRSLGYPDMLEPLPSSHTAAKEKEAAGRTEKKVEEKTAKGEETSDTGANQDK